MPYSTGKQNVYFIRSSELRRLRLRSLGAPKMGQNEVCGVLPQRGLRQLELWFLNNRSANAESFQIEPTELRHERREIRERSMHPIGTFHSHPISEPIPGKGDMLGAAINSLCLICDVCGRTAKLWKIVKRHGRRYANEGPLASLPERNRSSRSRTK